MSTNDEAHDAECSAVKSLFSIMRAIPIATIRFPFVATRPQRDAWCVLSALGIWKSRLELDLQAGEAYGIRFILVDK
jgi:hypothetical protein